MFVSLKVPQCYFLPPLPSTLPPSHLSVPSVCDGVVDSTVEQFLEVASSHVTEEQCISQLASLAQVSLPRPEQTSSDSSTFRDTSRDSDHAYGIRATA